MELPILKYDVPAAQRETVAFRGLNLSDLRQEGELSACENLSDRRYPYLSPRKSRSGEAYASPTAIFSWGGKMILVDGTTLLYDGEAVGTVTAGEKQFAVVNTKLCIWPDGAYLDLTTKEFGALGAAVESAGKVTFTGNSVSLTGTFGTAAAEYTGHHQSGRPGGAARTLVMKYSSAAWSETGGWVLTGEEEVSVQSGGAGSPVDGVLAVGDIVMLKATGISGNYQLNTRSYILDRDDKGTETESYGTYGENNQQGYYGKIVSTQFETVTTFDSVHIFKQTVTFDVFNAGMENVPLSSLYAAGQTVTISGSAFSYRNREKARLLKVEDTVLTFADGTFDRTDSQEDQEAPPLPRLYATLTANQTAGTDGFLIREAYMASDSEGNAYTDYHNYIFTEPASLAAGETVMVAGIGSEAKLYLYDPSKHEDGMQLLESTYQGYLSSTSSYRTLSAAQYDGREFGTVTIRRDLPELDFICESENRLWGVSNRDRTIYASALGDPKVFFDYSGLSTDSYAAAVGSDGDFTAMCAYGGAVLAWKERTLHKILGSYPAEYQMAAYQYAGVRAGCHKSVVNINEVLYYLGNGGVYAYAGGAPDLVSRAFGQQVFQQGAAGTDGQRYFLSAMDLNGEWSLLAYNTADGLWLREDGTKATDFCRLEDKVMFLSGNTVHTMDSGTEDVEWSATLAPFYETVEGRKRLSRLLLRVELPKGSWMRAEVRCDGRRWVECGKIVGRGAETRVLPIAPNRCDKFEVRLSGKGDCAVLSMLREFRVGGTA